MTTDDTKLYSQQFDNINRLVGKRIEEIVFYLDESDKDFSEVENSYGKSLHSGIDIMVDNKYFSIGCRFTDIHYGLIISKV